MNTQEREQRIRELEAELAQQAETTPERRLVVTSLLEVYHTTTCYWCGQPITEEQDSEYDGLAEAMIHTEPCFQELLRAEAKRAAQEREAETRNEEVLYKYELPRY